MSSFAFAFKDNVTANKAVFIGTIGVSRQAGIQGQHEETVQCKLFLPCTGPSLTWQDWSTFCRLRSLGSHVLFRVLGHSVWVKIGPLKNGRGTETGGNSCKQHPDRLAEWLWRAHTSLSSKWKWEAETLPLLGEALASSVWIINNKIILLQEYADVPGSHSDHTNMG